jgi:hypothetical protein
VSDQSTIPHGIQVGDTIAYTSSFLDRQHVDVVSAASAMGKVKALHRLESGIIFADIEWNKRGLPKRVNIKNITKIKDAALAE